MSGSPPRWPGALGALLYHDGVAQALVEGAADAELCLYPGSAHLFTDPTLADYDESAARLGLERSRSS
jgi:dienelactone hydrolase